MMRTILATGAAILIATCTLAAGSASAATADHLQCFKIKDAAAKAAYTANFTPNDPAFANLAPGCTIKVPAKLLCVGAAKSSVMPTPPGAPDGATLDKYLCYKAKCEKLAASATLTDQFGSHAVATKSTSIVCAPVAGCIDSDGDDFCTDVDCDDSDPDINPDATEVCDTADNDCDGQTDEGFNVGASCSNTNGFGSCNGVVACDDFGGSICAGPVPSAEVCDGADNNCDGEIDDANPGGGQPCTTGIPGQCSPGTTACTSGSIVCNQNMSASGEVCDGADNDCNGIVDNGNPGGGFPCNTGLVGQCAAGTTVCSGGLIMCTQNTPAAPSETCGDGIDNNCNGSIDEGC